MSDMSSMSDMSGMCYDQAHICVVCSHGLQIPGFGYCLCCVTLSMLCVLVCDSLSLLCVTVIWLVV